MSDKIGSRILAWAGFGLLLFFVFICHFFPLTDTDIWWHLSSGRWMAEHHSLPRVDPFCVSSLGQPWLDAQWGFQILVYAVWKMGGSEALVIGKALLASILFSLLLFRGWNRCTLPFLFAIGSYAAFHGRYLADVRPIWVTLVLLAIQYRFLRDALDGRRAMPWMVMTLTQIALTQVQGLHWLGPIQCALLSFGHFGWSWKTRQARQAGWLIGLLGFSGWVNPYGWQGWIFPLSLFSRIIPAASNIFSREISENIPFGRWISENPAAAFPFLIMAVLAAGLWFFTRPRTARGEALVLVVYSTLGFMAQRNLPLFIFGFLVLVVRILPDALDRAKNSVSLLRYAVIFSWVWCTVQTGFFMWKLAEARQWEISGSWETPFRFPQGAVQYLKTHALHGAMFNEMRHGGYLAWHLFPNHHPFLDGRMVLHDDFFLMEFLDVFDHPETFEAYRQKFGITWAVLPLTEGPRYRFLAAHLAQSGLMAPVFCDGAEVLFTAPEAWAGWEKPIPWTLAQGDSAARVRFGKNPRLLEIARNNLKEWKSFKEVY